MDKFLKRKVTLKETHDKVKDNEIIETSGSSKRQRQVVDIENLPSDPGLRKQIVDYHPNDRDQIRRAYLQKGPFQPKDIKFSQTKFGKTERRFDPAWYAEHKDWLEYSKENDVVFCLYCYCLKPEKQEGGGDAFVTEGFKNWKKKEKIGCHVGGHNSAHNEARRKCESLFKQNQNIMSFMSKQSEQEKHAYRTRLEASVDCVRFLQRQGLSFRGHDESEDSRNRGNFIELLHFLAKHNERIGHVVLNNAPENLKLVAPEIQKEIAHAGAVETTIAIIDDLGDAFFCILVDECRDMSNKEQLAVALRYVNKNGHVVERFLGIVHLLNTTAQTLKEGIELLLSKHGLTISRLRGQGYDGASNMRGELNGLKTLIMKENECAYYIHCFAHQLQLAIVAVAKSHVEIAHFFNLVALLFNVAGASCKRHDQLREKQAIEIAQAIEIGEIKSGRDLNQEKSLKRAGDTRWGSHYNALVNLISMFASILDVVETVMEDGSNSEQRVEAYMLSESIKTYDFVFNLHLMKRILGITDELSQALQRKDQDIGNAMKLVGISKQRIQIMRNDEWDSYLLEVSSFCVKHEINIPNMDDKFMPRGHSRRRVQQITNLHHYRAELFYSVLDMQLQELNSRFIEVNTELLLCLSCLNPERSFEAYKKERLLKFAEFYPNEFSSVQLQMLDNQLETYIIDMRSDDNFAQLNGIAELAEKMVEKRKDIIYPLVYLLLRLALTLPVATATVERAFSAMKIVKNRLRNRMGDQWMNDNLVTYIEKEMFESIDNETIMQRFQHMKTRRGELTCIKSST